MALSLDLLVVLPHRSLVVSRIVSLIVSSRRISLVVSSLILMSLIIVTLIVTLLGHKVSRASRHLQVLNSSLSELQSWLGSFSAWENIFPEYKVGQITQRDQSLDFILQSPTVIRAVTKLFVKWQYSFD